VGDLELEKNEKAAAEKRAKVEAEIAAERKAIEENNNKRRIAAETAVQNAAE
jgi:hypothetical protein